MVHALPISDAAAGLSVSQALALAGQGIQAATGGPTWVYGEVDGMVRSRAGHLYWCLVDGEARLSVVAFCRRRCYSPPVRSRNSPPGSVSRSTRWRLPSLAAGA